MVSNWLYQFWLFSFKTAKFWGRGPRRWDAKFMSFDRFNEIMTRSSAKSPGRFQEIDRGTSARLLSHHEIPEPTQLCRWSIHTSDIVYEPEVTAEQDPNIIDDPENEASWTEWPKSWHKPDMPNALRDSLETNQFSNIRTEELPLDVSQVLRSTPQGANEMLIEAVVFSITSRNDYALADLLDKAYTQKAKLDHVHPCHLAATYLDGSRTCCNTLDHLFDMVEITNLEKAQLDDLGHTVIDKLLITVIRSHSSCIPGFVDRAWTQQHRFPGADVDICGRWDADSDCIRASLAAGNPMIPNDWKHKFCHTSAQTIFHCLISICEWDILLLSRSSGLFVRRCTSSACGLKLELQPLHAIIATAFLLAQYGMKGEDLFGMLACLLCTLSYGAKPLAKAAISLTALLEIDQTDACDHEMLDAREFAEKIKDQFYHSWPEDIMEGWDILLLVLERSQHQWNLARSSLLGSLQSEDSIKRPEDVDKELRGAFRFSSNHPPENQAVDSNAPTNFHNDSIISDFLGVDGSDTTEEDDSDTASSVWDLEGGDPVCCTN